jgi:hypothetical protein
MDKSFYFSEIANITTQPQTWDEESTVLPPEIADFADVFECKPVDDLPEHSEFDCTIDLKPGASPKGGKVYKMTSQEDETLRKYLQDSLKKGWIRRSSSSFSAPCFFVKKQDWTKSKKLRLCVDYRELNSHTIKNRNPLPLISEILRTVGKGTVFTTLDLENAYQRIRIKEGHEERTAFLTRYGLYEFLVMPFGLANAPATSAVSNNDG